MPSASSVHLLLHNFNFGIVIWLACHKEKIQDRNIPGFFYSEGFVYLFCNRFVLPNSFFDTCIFYLALQTLWNGSSTWCIWREIYYVC